MQEIKERRIDGHTYRVMMIGAKRSLRMLAQLGKMLAPALAKAAEGGSLKSIMGADLSQIDLSGMAQMLVDRLDEDALVRIVEDLAAVTTFSDHGKDWPNLGAAYDIHFAGRLASLAKWLAFALEVQFGDFFGVLGSLAKSGAAQAIASASPSPSTSTGRSGAA
jgi:hypothetical protein